MTPAEVVEYMIGRPEVAGPAIGMHNKAAYAWRKASKFRDAGDITSPRIMRRLLAYAAARQIPLRAEHLIWGARRADVVKLMASHPAEAVTDALAAPQGAAA